MLPVDKIVSRAKHRLGHWSRTQPCMMSNQSGSVAIIFGLTMLALGGMTALAVDFSRALAVRSKLQSAADAAVLAADPLGTLSVSQAEDNVSSIFAYNMPTNFLMANQVVATPLPITNGYRVTASAKVPMAFGKLFGINTVQVNVIAEAIRAQNNLEIVLVLDNTYSMTGSKISDLQSAATNLVNQIENGSTPGTVKFALVPFSNYVNVGLQYNGALWLSVQPDQTINYSYQTTSPQNCSSWTTVNYSCTIDGVSTSCSYQQCTVTVPPYTASGSYTVTWQGCVGSRMPAPDETVTASFSSPILGLTAVNNNPISCPTALTRLTSDSSAIITQINGMVAQGETYIPAGLMWGWRVLDPNSPFGDGVAYNSTPKTKKIMILMTDGFNTKQQTPGATDHETAQTQPGPADTVMNDICTKIKALNIQIYAIDYEVNSTTAQSLLKNCATDPNHYYNAQDSTALNAAFNSIAGSLIKLALSK